MNVLLEHKDTLQTSSPEQIVQWAVESYADSLIMTTSFGIYSAAMLHLVTRIHPEIPIIWIDTGYLPAQTYSFAADLEKSLNLNLKVYQSPVSPARMESLQGKLYESEDVEDLNAYDLLRKVEPMHRALQELGAKAWIAGLRANQTENRKSLGVLATQNGIQKIHPIIQWTTKDIYNYLQTHNLPLHPLYEKGYQTVGDWHSSRPMRVDDVNERDTRFKGKKQECGLHLELSDAQKLALDSSNL